MATRKNIAPAVAQSSSLKTITTERRPADADADGFDELLRRMLNTIGHVQCADRVLYDMQNVPEALQPAAIVLHDATEALRRLYDELDTWGLGRGRRYGAGGAQ